MKRTLLVLASTATVVMAVSTLVFGDARAVSPAGTWSGHSTVVGRGLDYSTRLVLKETSDSRKYDVDMTISIPGAGTYGIKTVGKLAGNVLSFDSDLGRSGITSALNGQTDHRTMPFHAQYSFTQDGSDQLLDGGWSLDGMTGHEAVRRSGTGWSEKYMGGSKGAEDAMIADLVTRVVVHADAAPDRRALHNKGVGLKAKFRVLPTIARDLQVGLFNPGAEYDAIIRFSNAGPKDASDALPDQRGLAIRVKTGKVQKLLSGNQADAQDFLATNSPITARDPVEFVDVAHALLHATEDPGELARLFAKYGGKEAFYGIFKVSKHTDFMKESYTDEKIWSSRAPIKWGQFAVKFQLTPAAGITTAELGEAVEKLEEVTTVLGENHLSENLARRLEQGDITLTFSIQRFESEKTTPIEDGSVEWKTAVEPVAQLVIMKQDLDAPAAKALAGEIEKMAFTPWNCTEDFRPLGSLMRARLPVYASSAGRRGACPFGFGR